MCPRCGSLRYARENQKTAGCFKCGYRMTVDPAKIRILFKTDKSEEASVLNKHIKIGEYLKKIFDRFNKEILNNISSELETEINSLIGETNKISELNVKITTDNNDIDFKTDILEDEVYA